MGKPSVVSGGFQQACVFLFLHFFVLLSADNVGENDPTGRQFYSVFTINSRRGGNSLTSTDYAQDHDKIVYNYIRVRPRCW